VGSLWRRGGRGERALLIGLAATVLALLHSHEWYGGGAPPARYLVPALPALALAGATLLRLPVRARRLAFLALPPALLSWWVLLSRPHLSINPGDGGYWLADALARRFAAGARHLFPSFLARTPATLIVPLVGVALVATLIVAARRCSACARAVASQAVAVWLIAAAAVVLAITQRHDRVVEIEEPQVSRRGGRPEPPEGTFSRFLHRGGWRLGDGEAIVIPLHLVAASAPRLEGWASGLTSAGFEFRVAWDDATPAALHVGWGPEWTAALPPPPAAGRHALTIALAAPPGTDAVLDRLVVPE
jgi:hypothetical protein